MADNKIMKEEKAEPNAVEAAERLSVGNVKTIGLGDADEALAAFAGHESIEVDEATNKRILRKIDRRILPILCVVYGL